MNHEQPEQFLTAMRTISLSPTERSDLRTMLVEHMAAHPRRTGIVAMLGRHAFAYGLASALLLAGGATALANRATPGNLLYPLRLAVNDRVAVAVSGNDDAQLDTELSQIDRMISDEEQAGTEELSGEQDEEDKAILSDDATKGAEDDLKGIDSDLRQIEQDQPSED